MASGFPLLLLFLYSSTLFYSTTRMAADAGDSIDLVVDESGRKLQSAEDLFAICQRNYGKMYFSTEEYHYRFWVFKNNMARSRLNRFIPRPLTESCDLTANEPRRPALITREHCMRRVWYMPDERDMRIWRERYGMMNFSTLPPMRKPNPSSFPVVTIGSF